MSSPRNEPITYCIVRYILGLYIGNAIKSAISSKTWEPNNIENNVIGVKCGRVLEMVWFDSC